MAGAIYERIRADGLPGGIFLQTWGEEVIRYPRGVLTAPQKVLAIVTLSEGDAAQEDVDGDGRRIPMAATLEVSESQETDKNDLWSLTQRRGFALVRWTTAGEDAESDPGMKAVAIKRTEGITTSRTRGR